MRRILKKNQVVLTLLAVMIAVAGYLNYTADNKDADSQAAASGEENVVDELLDISDEDILAENEALTSALQETLSGSEETAANGESVQTGETAAGEVNAQAESEASGEATLQSSPDVESDTPGTAILTGGSTVLDYVASVQLSREQTRAKNKETLMQIIDNANVDEAQKQEAIDSMLNLTAIAEKETAAESLLAAKGFENCIVYINNDSVDVVVGRTSLTDAERAQVEDIVKRKTEVSADKIVITLLEIGE